MRALVVAFLLLAGCSRGPDEAALRRDVEARLAQALPPGTLTLAVLERRGSQSDTKAPAGETRRVVYFDAAMTLERDFDFGAWDAPGVAGLVSALGAGPKGIAGIRSGGTAVSLPLRRRTPVAPLPRRRRRSRPSRSPAPPRRRGGPRRRGRAAAARRAT